MNKKTIIISAKTNMHVGSGKANFGVIDQLVQRDAVYQTPTIHGSSLKGALKEHVTNMKLADTQIKNYFGSAKANQSDSGTGQVIFNDAHLLAIPVRSDKVAYMHITCPMLLANFAEHAHIDDDFKNEIKALLSVANADTSVIHFAARLNAAIVEDFDIKTATTPSSANATNLRTVIGHDLVVISDKYFKRLTNDLHLPVIARNFLENGESKNLWYEQVVPRLTIFWTNLMSHQDFKPLLDIITKEDNLVQIGANATIGYGYSQIRSI